MAIQNPANGNGLMQVEASHGDTPQVNIQKGIAHLKGNIDSGKALGLDLPVFGSFNITLGVFGDNISKSVVVNTL